MVNDNSGMCLRAVAFTLGCILIGAHVPAWAQEPVGEPPRSGWYVGGSLGARWAAPLDQEGWNREGTCYPTDACFDVERTPPIPGYRWRYTVDSAVGRRYEIALGYLVDRVRFEFSLAHHQHGLVQRFRDITYDDGTRIVPRPNGTVVSNAQASIDQLRVRTLAFQVYYDVPMAFRAMVPYVGLGMGPAFATISGVRFSTRYEETAADAPAYDPPLSFYDSRQEEDLSDTVLAARLHTGIDYGLDDRTRLGVRLSYAMLGPVEASGVYTSHPWHAEDPRLRNHNRFTDARAWTLMLTFQRRFGY